jgi:hypothetical protein
MVLNFLAVMLMIVFFDFTYGLTASTSGAKAP